jgi:hypothetical protein
MLFDLRSSKLHPRFQFVFYAMQGGICFDSQFLLCRVIVRGNFR